MLLLHDCTMYTADVDQGVNSLILVEADETFYMTTK